jgi:hypothetical protein
MEGEKKILVLGGNAKMIDLVKTAQGMGMYVIVADWYDTKRSPAKLIANEYWNDSIQDYDTLSKKIIDNNVNGIITSITDSYLEPYRILCERTGLPCYATKKSLDISVSKVLFKEMCQRYDVPVARKYNVGPEEDKIKSLPYPVIVKPVDGSGSRGFHIINKAEDFERFYTNALSFSPSKNVLVEDYIPYDATIIHYTMIDGKCYYSGMTDKYSCRFAENGASVMGLQLMPSKGEAEYLKTLDANVRRMFESEGFQNGPIWIEAFYDGKKRFVFNEMGYRFGGSLTYFPVRYFYGIDQLKLLLSFAVGEKTNVSIIQQPINETQLYCILPIHIKPGKICRVEGEQELMRNKKVYAYAPGHLLGDEIQAWGSAQQVFAYLHVIYSDIKDLKQTLEHILETLRAFDENNNQMLYTLFDINKLTTN